MAQLDGHSTQLLLDVFLYVPMTQKLQVGLHDRSGMHRFVILSITNPYAHLRHAEDEQLTHGNLHLVPQSNPSVFVWMNLCP